MMTMNVIHSQRTKVFYKRTPDQNLSAKNLTILHVRTDTTLWLSRQCAPCSGFFRQKCLGAVEPGATKPNTNYSLLQLDLYSAKAEYPRHPLFFLA
jgi:hypothetical protein